MKKYELRGNKYVLRDNEYDELLRENLKLSAWLSDPTRELATRDELARAGFPPDACEGFESIEVPYLNWTAIGVAVLPIFLPLILWLIGTWIARGFVAASGRQGK